MISKASLPFWGWLSVGVGIVATLFSPILILMASLCCGRVDPSQGMLLAPARPLLAALHAAGSDSLQLACLAIGLSYGLSCYLIGFLVGAVRWRLP